MTGDFRSALYVIPHAPFSTVLSEEATIARVCAELETSALVGDPSPNPYSWILVKPDGTRQPVHVDVDSLDEREELRVAQ